MKNIITPTIIMSDDFFTTTELSKICRALAIVNAEVVSPPKTKGRFAICRQFCDSSRLHATVVGKFVGEDVQEDNLIAKINTLAAHSEVSCAAHISTSELAKNELNFYGASRFHGRFTKFSNSVLRPYETKMHQSMPVVFGFGFSDGADDWQDEILVAAIWHAIKTMDRFELFDDDLEQDPVIYNSRSMVAAVLARKSAS